MEHMEPTEEHDEEEHDEIDAHGQPIREEVTVDQLHQGVDIVGELPELAHKTDHPTPEHDTGRLTP
jgi:hypothetical protein